MDRVVIIGGGPGGYEAAHVAAQLGAEVTIVDTDGIGGSAVLTDCVPSKTLIATAEVMSELSGAAELGVNFQDAEGDAATAIRVDLGRVNTRVKQLATDQSDSPHLAAQKTKAELYFACAETDIYAPQEIIDKLTAAVKGANAEVEVYPGTHHGFAFPKRPVYHRDAAERHWERLLALYRRNLSK